MTNRELVLNMLAEVAIKGATVARNARLEMEEVLGEKIHHVANLLALYPKLYCKWLNYKNI